jgi:NAD(P)-dependent dehydrogenase (short-subunit alcohol dehydrogenase family)
MVTRLEQLMDMSGRTALITGASGCLGRVICETLAELGADIIATDRPGGQLEKLAGSNAAIKPVFCDLELQSDRHALIEMVKGQGKLDVLINNAAFVGTNQLEGWATVFDQQNLESWRRALEVNLTAAFDLSQRTAPLLKISGHGSIINIGSIYGMLGPDWSLYEGTTMANPAAYSVSKGGLLQLTRWLAATLGPDIRVNSISPGGIARGQHIAFIERYAARTPLKRMATEDDFRGAVAYLVSDLSNYVTGQDLVVDGGWSVW